jgi:hypothetical protein
MRGFINGQPLEGVQRMITDVSVRSRPARYPSLNFGLSAFVIARDTDKTGAQHLTHLLKQAAEDQSLCERQKINTDPDARTFQTVASTCSARQIQNASWPASWLITMRTPAGSGQLSLRRSIGSSTACRRPAAGGLRLRGRVQDGLLALAVV